MNNMRNLVLDRIETLRTFDGGFDSRTMRWSGWYLCPRKGMSSLSKKERNDAVPLGKTTREHFDALSDGLILEAYELLIRLFSKQM